MSQETLKTTKLAIQFIYLEVHCTVNGHKQSKHLAGILQVCEERGVTIAFKVEKYLQPKRRKNIHSLSSLVNYLLMVDHHKPQLIKPIPVYIYEQALKYIFFSLLAGGREESGNHLPKERFKKILFTFSNKTLKLQLKHFF